MVFPSIVAIGIEDVVEDHCAQAQHNDLADIPDVKRCVKSVGLQRLPAQPILITECRDMFAQDVA